MLDGCISSLRRYCNSLLYHRLTVGCNQVLVKKLQRRCSLSICRGYGTLSTETAHLSSHLLAGSLPLGLELVERAVQYLVSKSLPVSEWGHLRSRPLSNEPTPLGSLKIEWKKVSWLEWEKRWARHSNSQWTHKLFPTVADCMKDSFVPSFWLTQGLLGYSCFAEYLHRRGPRTTALCPCGGAAETAKPVLTECPQFAPDQPVKWNPIHQIHLERDSATMGL